MLNYFEIDSLSNLISSVRRELNDIFISELNIGIEYIGYLFHTEWGGGKQKNYHLFKTDECKKQGVGLIHIFEDEFFLKKDIVFNKIKLAN